MLKTLIIYCAVCSLEGRISYSGGCKAFLSSRSCFWNTHKYSYEFYTAVMFLGYISCDLMIALGLASQPIGQNKDTF